MTLQAVVELCLGAIGVVVAEKQASKVYVSHTRFKRNKQTCVCVCLRASDGCVSALLNARNRQRNETLLLVERSLHTHSLSSNDQTTWGVQFHGWSRNQLHKYSAWGVLDIYIQKYFLNVSFAGPKIRGHVSLFSHVHTESSHIIGLHRTSLLSLGRSRNVA